MGIRYYAYAYEADVTEQAVTNPDSVLSSDPLADAWGLEPHAMVSIATMEQAVPKRDMLYLDKAWRHFQDVTGPQAADEPLRAAYRMFEGAVTNTGWGHHPWVRTLVPDEVVVIARDLAEITDEEFAAAVRARSRAVHDPDDEAEYATSYLATAQTFMAGLAREGRGMVYTIR